MSKLPGVVHCTERFYGTVYHIVQFLQYNGLAA